MKAASGLIEHQVSDVCRELRQAIGEHKVKDDEHILVSYATDYRRTFYAKPSLVILSGLKVNTALQVLDTERKAIAGLYAPGNASRSFFGGNVYPTTTPGLTHSRAWTFGRLAGLNAGRENGCE